MDAFQFLRTEHRKASQLLRRLKTTADAGERDRLFRELKQELETDAQVEREFFYPPLLQRQATADVAGGGIHDLDELNQLLATMSSMPKEGGDWSSKLDQLQKAVDGHIRNEEDGVFRKALGVFNKDQREDLGERMRSRKLRLIQGGASAETAATAREEVRAQRAGEGAGEAASKAAEGARQTGERIAEGAREAGERVAEQTGAGAREAAGNMEQLTRAAKEQSKGFAATQARYLSGQLGGLAKAVRQTANNLNDEQQAEMAAYLKRAAGGLERLSGTLEEGNVDAIVARSSQFARRQPAVFVGGAVVAGFLLSRFLKSSEQRHGS